MQLTSNSFAAEDQIPGRCAFAVIDPDTHVALADNLNPHLAWSGAPAATQSYALVCIDPDAPTVPDDVNKEGHIVRADLPRADFAHWAVIDIPASVTEIAEGSCSRGVTPGGKQNPEGPSGSRQGKSDYTSWFAGDAEMEGTYLGYDGPCPPWNDARVHRYVFTVMALSVAKLDLPDGFSAQQVLDAAANVTLAAATLTGTYTLNPAISPPS